MSDKIHRWVIINRSVMKNQFNKNANICLTDSSIAAIAWRGSRWRDNILVIDEDAIPKHVHTLSAIAQWFALPSLALMFSTSQCFYPFICVDHRRYHVRLSPKCRFNRIWTVVSKLKIEPITLTYLENYIRIRGSIWITFIFGIFLSISSFFLSIWELFHLAKHVIWVASSSILSRYTFLTPIPLRVFW